MIGNLKHYILYRLGYAPAQTQTTPAEQQCVVDFAKGKLRAAEIGVYHGFNTRAIRESLAANGVMLAIDPFERDWLSLRGYAWARRVAHLEANRTKNAQLVWIEQRGCDAPQIKEVKNSLPVDFLFIDGDHSFDGLKGDWLAWKSHVTVGGILALHDSRNRNGCGSERYTNEVILQDKEWMRIEAVDSLTVLKRL